MECGSGNLGRILREAGFEVAIGVHAGEILPFFESFRPEAFVAGTAAAGGAALELTRHLRSSPGASAVPILHVTPAGRDQVLRSLECADACLEEPVDPPVFCASVSALIRHYRSRPAAQPGADPLCRMIARHLPKAAVCVFDRDLRCTFADGPALHDAGCSRESIEGKSLSEIDTSRGQIMLHCIRRALRGESFSTEESYSGRVFLTQFVPLRDERQEISAAMVLATDVTRREHAEEALRESEKRYRLLFETSPIGVASISIAGDDWGRVLDANDAWLSMTGYTREELPGLDLKAITPADSMPVTAAAVARLRDTGRSGLYEKEYIRKDGAVLPVLITCACIGENREEAVGFVVDITERKRLEAQLRDSQKMESIGVLAGGVAHDFNNLLTTILGNASLLSESLPDESPEHSRIQQIVRSAEQAAELTRQLLAYAGKGGFTTADLDLQEIVCDIAPHFRTSIPAAIALELHFEDGVPAIRADRGLMHQVLMNLLLNAFEACGERPGLIRIHTGTRVVRKADSRRLGPHVRAGRYAVLEVRDNGCGIDAAMLPRIFDPFFSTKFAGRGLGLAALQGIVRSHHGFVEVDSKPGEGTTFRVMLPAARGSGPDSPA